jgi:hypothetical protein
MKPKGRKHSTVKSAHSESTDQLSSRLGNCFPRRRCLQRVPATSQQTKLCYSESIGVVIPVPAIHASIFNPDFELHHRNSENRKPNIGFTPVKDLNSITPATKGFITPKKSIATKSAVTAQAKAKKIGMVAIPD